MEFKGTKGEWSMPHLSNDSAKCNCTSVLCESICSSIGKVVFELTTLPKEEKGTSFENEYPTIEEAKANGMLIAASKDLLEACLEAEKHHQGGHSEIGRKLRAAISKALIQPNEKTYT